jgi:hypothetical protein
MKPPRIASESNHNEVSHCTIHFHDNWFMEDFVRHNGGVFSPPQQSGAIRWRYRSAKCPRCDDVTIEIAPYTAHLHVKGWRQVYPIGANRGPVPPEVPEEIAAD